jgi:hypothetical protein
VEKLLWKIKMARILLIQGATAQSGPKFPGISLPGMLRRPKPTRNRNLFKRLARKFPGIPDLSLSENEFLSILGRI